MQGKVTSLARSSSHSFSKQVVESLELLAGIGVLGDAHAGTTVKHRSRVAIDPSQPNLRQVHLIGQELFEELANSGFAIAPGELGENITTRGIDLLALPRGTLLNLGNDAVLEVTGLRNPCRQIEAFSPGLLARIVDRAPDGMVVRKAGIMAIVVNGGTVRTGDPIAVRLPPLPHVPLDRV